MSEKKGIQKVWPRLKWVLVVFLLAGSFVSHSNWQMYEYFIQLMPKFEVEGVSYVRAEAYTILGFERLDATGEALRKINKTVSDIQAAAGEKLQSELARYLEYDTRRDIWFAVFVICTASAAGILVLAFVDSPHFQKVNRWLDHKTGIR